jgi:hypothetical protein
MKAEFVAFVIGSAAGATAILALFVKGMHLIQMKIGVGAVKAFLAKALAGLRR